MKLMNKLKIYKIFTPIIIACIVFVIFAIKNPKLCSLEAMMLLFIVFYLSGIYNELKTYNDNLRLEKKIAMLEKERQENNGPKK